MATDPIGRLSDAQLAAVKEWSAIRYVVKGEHGVETFCSGTAVEHVAGLLVHIEAQERAFEEREAACCPEDVGFEEWIKTLKSKLAQAEAREHSLKHSLIEASALASAHATRIKTLETALLNASHYVQHEKVCPRYETMRGECSCGMSRLIDAGEPMAEVLAALASPSSAPQCDEVGVDPYRCTLPKGHAGQHETDWRKRGWAEVASQSSETAKEESPS